MTAVHDADNERLVRRAVDLFTFLGRSQQLLDRPVRLVDKYDEVVWFGDLPDHSAIQSAHRIAALTSEAPLLVANRVPKLDPPNLPTELTDWVHGDLGKAGQEPSLRDAIYVDAPVVEIGDEDDEPAPERHRVELADRPEVSEAFETWMTDWRLWSEQELRDAVARDVYKELLRYSSEGDRSQRGIRTRRGDRLSVVAARSTRAGSAPRRHRADRHRL